MNSRSLGYHKQTGKRISTRPPNAESITAAPWAVVREGHNTIYCQYKAQAERYAEQHGGRIVDEKKRSGVKQRKGLK